MELAIIAPGVSSWRSTSQAPAASIALLREDWRHLLMVPIYRLINDPLRAYLLYTSVLLAIRGGTMGWNKLQRTGSMDAAHDTVPESTRLTKVIA